MWINLTEGTFFFGSGGITVMKPIDLRDKPSTFIYRTELLSGASRVAFATETIEEINKMLEDSKPKKTSRSKE